MARGPGITARIGGRSAHPANEDHLRKLVLREPRAYPAHCCNFLVPPIHPEAQAGYIIMEQVEYPTMSGGNTILANVRRTTRSGSSLQTNAASALRAGCPSRPAPQALSSSQGVFLISTSMRGQNEPQTLRHTIMLNYSMGAKGEQRREPNHQIHSLQTPHDPSKSCTPYLRPGCAFRLRPALKSGSSVRFLHQSDDMPRKSPCRRQTENCAAHEGLPRG